MRVKPSAVRIDLCPDIFQRILSRILKAVQISLPHHSTMLAAPLPKTRILHIQNVHFTVLFLQTLAMCPLTSQLLHMAFQNLHLALVDYRLHKKSQCKPSCLKTAKRGKHLVPTQVKRVKFQTVMSLKPANPQKMHSGTGCKDCCCCACRVSLAAINHLQGFFKASFFNQGWTI